MFHFEQRNQRSLSKSGRAYHRILKTPDMTNIAASRSFSIIPSNLLTSSREAKIRRLGSRYLQSAQFVMPTILKTHFETGKMRTALTRKTMTMSLPIPMSRTCRRLIGRFGHGTTHRQISRHMVSIPLVIDLSMMAGTSWQQERDGQR